MADTPMTPTPTNQTANSTGVGIKRPEQGRRGGVLQSGIRAQAVKKPKKVRRGKSPDAINNGGVTSVSDSGTSMGSKGEGMGCTADSPDCGNEMCKVCMKKFWNIDQTPIVKNNTDSDFNDLVIKQGPCWDGYTQRGMKPGDGGKMVPNCVPVSKADDLWEDTDDVIYDTKSLTKAEGYSPPAGARSAARRAIKFKEDGKANGAGTSVGWTRAGQLARGETISLSTVKRMYSYFSRHEVDKKGKDWGSQSNPSNGYIMWLAWGGDAGFSWSRGIVEREKNNKFWSDTPFGQ